MTDKIIKCPSGYHWDSNKSSNPMYHGIIPNPTYNSCCPNGYSKPEMDLKFLESGYTKFGIEINDKVLRWPEFWRK